MLNTVRTMYLYTHAMQGSDRVWFMDILNAANRGDLKALVNYVQLNCSRAT